MATSKIFNKYSNQFNINECVHLMFSRKFEEGIIIDGRIRVAVVDGGRGQFKFLVNAPRDVAVFREELCEIDAPMAVIAPHNASNQ